MKAILLLLVAATAIQTTLAQVPKNAIFTKRYEGGGGRLRLPSASQDDGSSLRRADRRTPSDDSLVGIETSTRELIEVVVTSLSLSIPDTAVGGAPNMCLSLSIPDGGSTIGDPNGGAVGGAKSAKSSPGGGAVGWAKSAKAAGAKSAKAAGAKSAKAAGAKSAKALKSTSASNILSTTSGADTAVEPEKPYWSSKMVIATAAGVSAAVVAAVAVAALIVKRR
jgi:hypothetical protein